MSLELEEEFAALRRRLDRLASDPDEELLERYELKRPPAPPGLYWRFRWLAGLILRRLQLSIWRADPWPVSLRQSTARARARPLLIWGVGADQDILRAACGGFSRLGDLLPGFVPVLVTDVPDFAFFSRLGWLVEYLPQLEGTGEQYEERKARFLARLYRGAPALPLSAGLAMASRGNEIRSWVNAQ